MINIQQSQHPAVSCLWYCALMLLQDFCGYIYNVSWEASNTESIHFTYKLGIT